MSGEPKTLTLTPEEILLAARDKDFMLAPTRTIETGELRWSLHKVTVVGSHREIDYLAGFDTLSQAGAWLLGVPVVARDEAAELRAALRTLVTDLEALMEESHLSLYDGDGALVDTSWGKVLQGGKDEYLGNWRDVKRLAGGESEK